MHPREEGELSFAITVLIQYCVYRSLYYNQMIVDGILHRVVKRKKKKRRWRVSKRPVDGKSQFCIGLWVIICIEFIIKGVECSAASINLNVSVPFVALLSKQRRRKW